MRFPKFELFSVGNAVCVDTGGKQRSLSTRFRDNLLWLVS